MNDSAPRTIPGYRTQRSLGRGNTSWVYLAFDERERKVALKIPFPETLAKPEAGERFANEVRLSLRLRHPNLVVGYAGTPFGTGSFLAMRYFPEGTLERWIDLGRMGTNEALRIVADIISALAYLHREGVVHQDVKPQNVYLDAGRAALGDFGSSYYVGQGGKTAGSPYYMAPEIYLGEESSFASDVYSLGVLMYEVLGGERPFMGESYDALMAAHMNRYPRPLTALSREVPAECSRLVERCLAKRPSGRPDIREVADLVGPLVGDLLRTPDIFDEPAAPPPKRPTLSGRHGPTVTPETSPKALPAGKPAEKSADKGLFGSLLKRKKG